MIGAQDDVLKLGVNGMRGTRLMRRRATRVLLAWVKVGLFAGFVSWAGAGFQLTYLGERYAGFIVLSGGESVMRNHAGMRAWEKGRAGLGLMHPRLRHVDDSAWTGDGMKFHDPKFVTERDCGISGCLAVIPRR